MVWKDVDNSNYPNTEADPSGLEIEDIWLHLSINIYTDKSIPRQNMFSFFFLLSISGGFSF